MSQLTGTSETIDGHEYTVYMLPPMTALDMLVDIGKMLGPGLGSVVDAVSGNFAEGGIDAVMEQNLDGAFFSKAATALFQNLNKASVRDVVTTLAGATHVDGKKLKDIFDIHFRGKLGGLAKWLAFSLKAQYGDFWSALADTNLGQGGTLLPIPSPSPKASTG